MKNEIKCILISPPSLRCGEDIHFLPRGILSMASFLEKSGYQTQIIPLSYYLSLKNVSEWSLQDIESVLKNFLHNTKALLVGVGNLSTSDYPTSLEILKICRQLNENIVTAIGGFQVTFMDIECARLPFVDIVARGEGEWTLLELMDALESKKDLEHIRGITFKKNGEIIRNQDRPPGDLNELPPLNFDLLPFEFIQKAYVSSMLTRGCDFNCHFCTEFAFWKKSRPVRMEQVLQEMETMWQVYKNPMKGLNDDMVYIGSERFSDLCNEIKKRKITLHSDFYVFSRVDSVEEQGLKDIQGTGIRFVWLGIESGSPKVLKMMNKKTSRENIISVCTKLKEYNLNTLGFWIIGHPGDNPTEQELSLELLEYLLKRNLLDKMVVSFFTPYPGTKFFAQPEKYGIEILTTKWSDWVDPIHTCQLKDFSSEEMDLCYQKYMDVIAREKPDVLFNSLFISQVLNME